MPSPRRFPPPWTIEENNNACFIVRDKNGPALAYVYFEDEPGRRIACPHAGRVLDEESAMATEPSPRCRHCGQTLRRMRLISDLCRLPDLRVFECADCDMSLIEGAEDLE
jgi:hypothetical protein